MVPRNSGRNVIATARVSVGIPEGEGIAEIVHEVMEAEIEIVRVVREVMVTGPEVPEAKATEIDRVARKAGKVTVIDPVPRKAGKEARAVTILGGRTSQTAARAGNAERKASGARAIRGIGRRHNPCLRGWRKFVSANY